MRNFIQNWQAEGLLNVTTQEGPTKEQRMTLMKTLKLRNSIATEAQKKKGWYSFFSADVNETYRAIVEARLLMHGMALLEASDARREEEKSRDMFAFTFEGKQYTYSRMPQGYRDSPGLFNAALKKDLEDLIKTQSSSSMWMICY